MPIETVNEIELVRMLGSGFFGEVHEANVRPFGRVAVKIIQCSKIASFFTIPPSDWPAIRDKLFAEADALSKGEHDHVVRIFGAHYDSAKDNGYIVTELCDGCIAAAIETGPLPLAEVNTYLRHALIGLEAIHRRGMVHRDLKPPNLLRKEATCKLSDFGLVTDRLVAGYASQAGYVEFQAPEIFATGRTSSKTDAWAMGLTAYQMLNGLPWHHEVLRSLGADKLKDPRAARARIVDLIKAGGFASRLPFMPHVPDAWRRFVHKAMHDDSNQRFQDASAMLNAMSSRGLPSLPSYRCVFDASGNITWSRPNADREEVIEWTRGAGATHAVLGQLRPPAGGSGAVQTLRRADHLASREAEDVLHTFFARRT
jgi:eukaryotic-like serine/threonine-protein kinase